MADPVCCCRNRTRCVHCLTRGEATQTALAAPFMCICSASHSEGLLVDWSTSVSEVHLSVRGPPQCQRSTSVSGVHLSVRGLQPSTCRYQQRLPGVYPPPPPPRPLLPEAPVSEAPVSEAPVSEAPLPLHACSCFGAPLTADLVRGFGPLLTAQLVAAMGPGLAACLVEHMGPGPTAAIVMELGEEGTGAWGAGLGALGCCWAGHAWGSVLCAQTTAMATVARLWFNHGCQQPETEVDEQPATRTCLRLVITWSSLLAGTVAE
jgi:hypothetical protein